MSNEEMITAQIGDVQITMPARRAVRAWLDGLVGELDKTPGTASSDAPPAVLQAWPGQGGLYVGRMPGQNGSPDYHLIAAAGPAGHIEKIAYGGADQDEPDAKSEFDGLANTRALVRSTANHPLASWAVSLLIDGHRDFYAPAKRELALINAVAPNLLKKGWVWSSTQHPANSYYAYCQYFGDGSQDDNLKGNELAAVAVRRLIIQ